MMSSVEIPDWLCGVTSRHFLLNGNLLPLEVETPVKSYQRKKKQHRDRQILKSGS